MALSGINECRTPLPAAHHICALFSATLATSRRVCVLVRSFAAARTNQPAPVPTAAQLAVMLAAAVQSLTRSSRFVCLSIHSGVYPTNSYTTCAHPTSEASTGPSKQRVHSRLARACRAPTSAPQPTAHVMHSASSTPAAGCRITSSHIQRTFEADTERVQISFACERGEISVHEAYNSRARTGRDIQATSTDLTYSTLCVLVGSERPAR